MKASLIGPLWTGVRIPEQMRCGVTGASSPPILITGIPEGAVAVLVEFNDLDFEPLATHGGHGVIAYALTEGQSELMAPPVLELETERLPDGVTIFANNRGRFPSGYRAPCGGQVKDHRYEATVIAVGNADGTKPLASAKLFLGLLQ